MLTICGMVVLALLPTQSTSPRSTEAAHLTARADVHRTHRRFDEAIATYRQALGLAPDSARARRGLGRVFDLLGRHADARAEYTAALARASRFEDTALLVDIATSFAFERRFDEAHAALRRWAELLRTRGGQDASRSPLFFQLAMAREDFDEAERVLEPSPVPPMEGGVLSPADATAAMALLQEGKYLGRRAAIAARRGRADEARRLLAQARAQLAKLDAIARAHDPSGPPPGFSLADTNDPVLLPVGEIAFWLGDMPRAIELLETHGLKLPGHSLLLGQAYERQGDLARARAAYTEVVEETVLSIELAWARPLAAARLAAIAPR